MKARDTAGIDWYEYFTADYEAGTLTWKPRERKLFPSERSWKMWNTRFTGKIAGAVTVQGYWAVRLLGKTHKVHRVLWEMANGPIPEGMQIDHVDQNKGNNSLGNLRLATHAQNQRNKVSNTNNTSGLRGVTINRKTGRFAARINNKHLGYFATRGLAAVAYAKASLKAHGTFSTFYAQL